MNNLLLLLSYSVRDRKFTTLYWILIWSLLALMMATFFDVFQESQLEFEQVLESFPDALKETFNISTGFLSQAENFFAGEFLALYTLAGAVMGVFMGVGSLRGKIESGYMDSILMNSIQRWQVVVSEWLSSLVFWFVTSGIIGGLSWFMFTIFTSQETISLPFFIAAMLGVTSIQIFATGLGMLVGMYVSKTVAQAIGSAVLAAAWLLDGFSGISGYPQFLKTINPFTYFDEAYLIEEYSLYWADWWLVFGLGWIFFFVTIWRFRSKDIS